MQFRNLRLATKLGGGFAVILCIVAASSSFFVYKTSVVSEIERLNNTSDDVVDTIDRLNTDLYVARSNAFKYMLTQDDADKTRVTAGLSQFRARIATLRTLLVKDATFLIPRLDAFEKTAETFIQGRLLEQLRLASAPATYPDAMTMVRASESFAYVAAFTVKYDALRADAAVWADGLTEQGAEAMTEMLIVTVAGGAVCVVLGMAIAWLTTRAIGRPIAAMTASMKSLAAGDLSVSVPALGQKDEIGEMAQAVQIFKEVSIEKSRHELEATGARQRADAERASRETAAAQSANEQAGVVQGLAAGLSKLAAGDLKQRLEQAFAPQYEGLRADFNGAVAKLEDTMQEVLVNTGAIRTGTGEIASASDDLSRRTEQQAASLEQTAAALDQITATVRKTAEGANHARQVVDAAKQDAERSGEVVSRAVAAMGGIETSSREIGQIVGVIDEIAFQTNLLALNAGVEAARAGDAGRGFAVVASEVRALAQRSAEAAKEIKTLIMASDRQVKAGVELVGETGQSLTRIVGQVAELNEVVTTIAASAQEQATGLAQVNTAVNQMDQVTQQNAAMVEQSTAAAHNLAQETSALGHLIERFQVSNSHAQPSARNSVAAPIKLAPAKTSAAKASVAKATLASTRPALKVVGTRTVASTAAQDWEEF